MFLRYFPLEPIGTNLVILACSESRQALLIDAPGGALEVAERVLKDEGFTAVAIFLTHTHWDHIIDCAAMEKRFALPVYVDERDGYNLIKPGSDELMGADIAPVLAPRYFLAHFQLGKLSIEILRTPGHSHGSVCFYLKNEKTLISGDTLFCGGMGRVDLPTSDRRKMAHSLALLALLPENTRVIPGHGEETTIGDEINWLKRYK